MSDKKEFIYIKKEVIYTQPKRDSISQSRPFAEAKKVLVIGSDTLAFQIVKQLRDEGVQVRAAVSKRETVRAEAMEKLGAEVFLTDLTTLTDVKLVMASMQRVYLSTSEFLDVTALIAAVAKASLDLELLVNMSEIAVSDTNIIEVSTAAFQYEKHWLAEQILNWSGIPCVHLRPSIFLEHPFFSNYASEDIRTYHELRLPLGKAKFAPIAMSDVTRCARFLLRCGNPLPHIGKVYELTGPESVDMVQIAEQYSKALKTDAPIKYADVQLDKFCSALPKRDRFNAQNDLVLLKMLRDNRFDRCTSTVKELTEIQATSVQEWVEAERFHLFDPVGKVQHAHTQ